MDIFSLYLFNLYIEHIKLSKAGFKKGKYGFKVEERNFNNLYFADQVTPIAKNTKNLQALKVICRIISQGGQ